MNRFFRLLIFAVLIFSGCSLKKDYLPEQITSLKLQKEMKNEEAKKILVKLHRRDVLPSENEIGFYEGPNSSAIVYVSRYNSIHEAQNESKRMTEKISPENSVFYGGQNIFFDGKSLYRCFGLGQIHFVFTDRESLIWVSVNPESAEKFLREYLRFLK
ncbi:MAG: hypothetical protein HXY48_04680 [Ignavibacteriaceae bacterium]|nr:hypothetical protein [Ignavibacteriaceae bacterium]